MRRWLAFASLCAGLVAGLPALASADPQVRIGNGVLQGVSGDGVLSFKGIPYAEPPTGTQRWRPPVPARPWQGVRETKNFGPSCLQPPPVPTSLYYGVMAPMAEDCLSLNVWAPAGAKGLPVMVWIHGGALVGGSSSEPLYDGTRIAQKGVIVVSINYRLGLLGFLAHPALSAEQPDQLSGNYGLLDQIEALRWVRDNIASFGGDPARVTIAGESAGGLSAIALMASPKANGLFRAAIVQSGYMPSYRALREETLGLHSAEAMGAALGKLAGVSDAASLRAADLVTLFKAGLATGWAPEPVIDGSVLTRQLADTFAKGEQAKVAVLAGFNEGEIRSLPFLVPKNIPATKAEYQADIQARFGDGAAAYLAHYPGDDPKEDAAASIRDGLYGWAAQNIVRQQAAAGQAAYLYYFRHSTPAQRERKLAAFHASELPYMFGQVGPDAALGPNWPKPPPGEDEARLSAAMMGYWLSFIRDGVPQAGGEVAWPRYRTGEAGYLEIGERPAVGRGLLAGPFAHADALVESRRRQGRAWRLDIGFAAF